MSIRLISFWRIPLKGKPLTNVLRIACSSTSVTEAHSKPSDVVSVKLKESTSVGDVLAAVQNNLGTLTHRHLVHALTCIFQIQKANKNEMKPKAIVKDPAFGVLCQNLCKHAREMEIGDTIEAIKVLSYLKVPVDAFIVQSLLQMVRCQINLMNIQQIIFLDFLLSQFDAKNHLVDALKLALPLAFQIQLPLELDQQDLPLLRHMLLYACSHNLPDRCINNVVTGLLLHDTMITDAMAKSIVWALCQINCTEEVYPTRRRLLGVCLDVMVRRVDKFTYEDLLRTAAKLKERIIEKHPEFYHEQFFDAVANYVIHNNLDFEQGVLVARVLSRIAHTHLGLAAYLCNSAASNPRALGAARPNILLGFVNWLSNNSYTPERPQWERLCAQLALSPALAVPGPCLPWTKLCLELASLGCYLDTVLQQVFSADFLQDYLARKNNVLDYLQLLTLHEAVRTFHTGYQLPADVIERARQLYPAGGALGEAVAEHVARGLGGREFVATNIVLPNGIIPDVCVCVHSGAALRVAREGARVPLEQLGLPAGTHVVCIMNFNQGCYSLNTNRLRGTFRLILDILERQGFATVAFNVKEWLGTPAHERTPYLMREIGYRCGEDIQLSAAW